MWLLLFVRVFPVLLCHHQQLHLHRVALRVCCPILHPFGPFVQARLTRTLLPGRRNGGAQGRPLGLLAAFLLRQCTGAPDLHRRGLGDMTHTDRLVARAALQTMAGIQAFQVLERPPRDEGDMEPPMLS